MLSVLREIRDSRLVVVPMAVSDFDGTATFYVDELGDQGCSSLLEFMPEHPRWPGRQDLRSTGALNVPVTRLDTYLKAHDIRDVRFLHIDAQGADLAVLRGLGRLAHRVRAGQVEAATSRERALYRGQPLMPQIERWLTTHGFRITHRTKNDEWGNEMNLEFSR